MAQHLQLDCSRHVLLCRVSVPHLRHHGTSARARTARRTAEWVRLDSSCCTCRAVRVGAAAAESTASGELPAELQKIVTTFSMVGHRAYNKPVFTQTFRWSPPQLSSATLTFSTTSLKGSTHSMPYWQLLVKHLRCLLPESRLVACRCRMQR